ncbi:MAG: polysaccharide deacetylase family protein [Acidimicrobiales bacterium]|nr:polysaccharide deacetylase family protein [Acidimicrobiales bacterium]
MSTTTWLDPVRAALDALGARGETRPVFFRDDDGGWDDDALTRLLDRFETAGVPIDVAVIPDAIRASTAQALARRAGRGLLHLHQHGLAHTNHEPEGRSWEFGPSRSTAKQYADIERGRRRLDELLGPASEPIFTPPWNRCTQGTADALHALGFLVLSRDHTAAPLDTGPLREVPVTVDWFGRAKGVPWDLDERGRRVAASLTEPGVTGIMLHHAVTDAEELAAIAELAALLAAHPQVRTTHLAALASVPA